MKESYYYGSFLLGEQMTENGLYVVKRDILNVITSLGGDCDINSGDKRPVFCCVKDNKIEGLYWAIPTSDISHRNKAQIEYYNMCMQCDDKDLRSCYYHIVQSNRTALYKISSCYPITNKYIDHEYTVNKIHVVIQKKKDIFEINRKFRRIISMENRKPNYFRQHITDVKNYLIRELEIEKQNVLRINKDTN
jgi:hypothetical protein|nr:MAG TPA: hypothetical protein [Caudoviricetes sp.]DAZ74995.1 MAG TPA: hypothetical protein [Caudoviricetes sp.]